ncbi:SWIB/MDM2 domain-containing protein [Dioscorea alata]|uniref:SWIB/MDM2 domain-containing protein n=1 Tax=Dioscorea alata TaxID=55571 RepID=A0ACB7TWN8_DIOAL|nr:SWIB/MDM2 domain-containing protein [Dioscorea alata]
MAASISSACCSAFAPADFAASRKPVLPLAVSLPRRILAPLPIRAVKAESKPSATPARKREPRGITKPCPISPELQALMGVEEIPRTQALKLIWAYIKEKNLQDPENKKVIICDEKLKKIFAGKDRVGFLEISGLLNPHFAK